MLLTDELDVKAEARAKLSIPNRNRLYKIVDLNLSDHSKLRRFFNRLSNPRNQNYLELISMILEVQKCIA